MVTKSDTSKTSHRYENFIHHLTLTCLLLCVTDTTAIHEQGLNPDILDEVLSGQATRQLKSTPPRFFYIQLQSHLKEKKISKGEIGTVYTKIDKHFQSYRPDNAYRAVERACNGKKCNPSDPMPYFTKKTSTQVLLDHASCTPIPRYQKRNVDRREARRYKQIQKIQKRFHEVQAALETMHNDNVVTEVALAKSKKLLEATTAQLHQKEREVSDLQQQHTDLNDTIHALVEENKAIQETIKQIEEELKGIDNDLYTSEQHGSSSLIPPLGSSSFADFQCKPLAVNGTPMECVSSTTSS